MSNITNHVWGYSGDNFGNIWTDWWVKYADANQLSPKFTTFINYPFGTGVGLNSDLEPLWTVPIHLLSGLFGGVAAFNLMILITFPLSGMAMFLLVNSLTKNRFIAALMGMIYMLLPFHFWQSYQHIALAQIQWIPLFLYSLFKLDATPNFKNGFLLGLTFVLVALSSVYLGYFSLLLAALFIIFKISYQFISRRINYLNLTRLKALGVGSLIVFACIIPIYFSVINGSSQDRQFGGFGTGARPLNDLLSLSIRPWDLVIPPLDHPVLGRFEHPAYMFIKSLGNDFKTNSAYLPERIVYIGLPLLILALIGFIFLLKSKNKEVGMLLAFLAAGLYLIASPPFVVFKGITIYLPSFFLYKLFPMVRAYSRMGLFVDLVVIILAAFGILFFINLLKNKRLKILFIASLLSLFIFEFINFPPYHFTDMTKVPGTYKWLFNQKNSAAVIEYPESFSLVDSLFFQTIHNHPLLNMRGLSESNTYSVIIPLINNPVNPVTASVLAALGLDYAIIHSKDPYDRANLFDETGLTQVLEAPLVTALQGNGVAGFQVEQKFDDGAVLRITSDPAKLVLVEDSNLNVFPKKDWVWGSDTNKLYLINTKNIPVKIQIDFSGVKTYDVKVTDQENNQINSKVIIELGVDEKTRIKYLDFTNIHGKQLLINNLTFKEI